MGKPPKQRPSMLFPCFMILRFLAATWTLLCLATALPTYVGPQSNVYPPMTTKANIENAVNVTIFKRDYPVPGDCGEERGVEQSNFNPHYFFPIHFGGFTVGNCSSAGYSEFDRIDYVDMKPFPGVSHNLTFYLFKKDS